MTAHKFPLSRKYRDFIRSVQGVTAEFLEGTTASGKTTVGAGVKFMYMVSASPKRLHIIAAKTTGIAEKNIIQQENGILDLHRNAVYCGNGDRNNKLPHIKFEGKLIYVLGYDNKDKWENDFCELVKRSITETLVTGDGAFKISLHPQVSRFPILEFYGADRVELRRQSGRVHEIIFRTPYADDSGRNYTLHEHYGRGYVTYALFDAYGNPRDLHAIPQTAGLQPVRWDGDFMLAEYLSFYHSNRHEGRGQSIFDAKRDNFDALDEAWSQWVDALRSGRSRTYIPECLIPRDENGVLQKSNAFDNRFLMTGNDIAESAQNKITVEQAEIPHDSYLATYITALDLCLQGIVSPSTLGIDVKKLDNAEAQREKEKTTLYTRQDIVNALQRVLPKLITDVFYAYQTANGQPAEEVRSAVTFGEYANPSFESQVETVAKAKQGGIMSIEAGLDELYGSTKSDTWKAAEAERIRTEQGIVDMEEPAVSSDGWAGIA